MIKMKGITLDFQMSLMILAAILPVVWAAYRYINA